MLICSSFIKIATIDERLGEISFLKHPFVVLVHRTITPPDPTVPSRWCSSPCKLQPRFSVPSWPEWHLVWSSIAVAFCLKVDMLCMLMLFYIPWLHLMFISILNTHFELQHIVLTVSNCLNTLSFCHVNRWAFVLGILGTVWGRLFETTQRLPAH